jgi:phage protein U
MPLMSLGLFVFALDSAPYQSLQQQLAWRHPTNSRVGDRPALQYLGKDSESIALSGVLYHEITGGQSALDELAAMADTGLSWLLIGAEGRIHGCFVIESIDVTRTVFNTEGQAKKIEFSMKLARADDDDVGLFDTLFDSGTALGI